MAKVHRVYVEKTKEMPLKQGRLWKTLFQMWA